MKALALPPQEHPDPELMSRVASGDVSALGELYDRYHRDVRRLVARLDPHSPHADDAVQSVFLALRNAALRYDGRPDARAFVLGVTMRVMWRQKRGLHRFRRLLGAFSETLHTVAADPEIELSRREEFSRFQRAFEKLAPKKREVFVLLELEGLSADEAAEILCVPSATVRTRLFHARKDLRAALAAGCAG